MTLVASKFSDHILEGDHASRPAPGDVPVGAIYSCDDHDTLYKSNGVDTWTDYLVAVASGGIPETLIDAKGDLIVGSADDTVGRLAVGTNGHVLTADSGETLGVKWAEAAGGGGSIAAARAWLTDNYHPDDYPASPNAADDEFNDASGMSGATNGLDARWAWRNQGTATATFEKAGWITLSAPSDSSSNFRIIEQDLSDGTYEARLSKEGTNHPNTHGGIVLVDGVNGDAYVFGWNWDMWGVQRWNTVTGSWNSDVANVTGAIGPTNDIYLRVVKSDTALQFWYSRDGIGWLRLVSITDAVVATKIGLFVGERLNTGLAKLHCDFFRKVA